MTDQLPSGRQVTLRAGEYAATVTEVGATLRSLTHRDRPLLLGFAEAEMADRGIGQILLPWPNRIQAGRYQFDGKAHQLPLSEPSRGNATHGLVRWMPWRLRQVGADGVDASVVLHPSPGYPFTLAVRVSYALSADGLRVRTRAANLGTSAAPYGHGMHPYLQVGSGPLDVWELTLPAARFCDVDQGGLPAAARPVDERHDFRTARAIGDVRLDNPFTELLRDDAGRAIVVLRGGTGGIELWMDRSYRWVQVFTGDTWAQNPRSALAVEPMTCPPNAFRSGADLVRLEPGGSHEAAWGLRAL